MHSVTLYVMLCCCLRTVDLMLLYRLWTELLCLLFSSEEGDFSCGETLFSQHSWTITSFPGSLLFQWVSWVTDDLMATRKKEVSKRHMKETQRFSKWTVCCQCFQSDFLGMLWIMYFYRVICTDYEGGRGNVGKSCELVVLLYFLQHFSSLISLCLCSFCTLSSLVESFGYRLDLFKTLLNCNSAIYWWCIITATDVVLDSRDKPICSSSYILYI